MLASEVVVDERVVVDVVDVEAVVDGGAGGGGVVGDDSNLFACGVYGAVSDVADQGAGILESSGLAHLLDLAADGEYSDVAFLGPADNEVVHDFKAADFAFTFWEGEGLLDLACQTEHVKAVVGGDDEGVLGDEEAPQGFLLDGGNAADGNIIVAFDHLKNLNLFAGPV